MKKVEEERGDFSDEEKRICRERDIDVERAKIM